MLEPVIIEIEQLNPEPSVQEQCRKLLLSTHTSQLLLISYPFEEYWVKVDAGNPQAVKSLTALYSLEKNDGNIVIRFTVTAEGAALCAALRESSADKPVSFDSLCDHFSLADFCSKEILPLSPIAIAKPWGQEIWYTGIEERGVAEVSNGRLMVPLPWILSALPSSLCADQQRALILLKILDPLPQEVFGDLYFELHEEKREVYVVTAIDKDVWPEGQGSIRFGFDQNKRKQYASDSEFRSAFVSAVKNYEQVRRQIDTMIDGFRLRDAFAINEPVSADVLARWLTELPSELQSEELKLRQQMDAFSHQLPLSLGDVVKVPCLTPHSLQHGVRTVEFQTPVYERLILSFAQKVLTQSHWDIDTAASIMTLDTPEAALHTCIVNDKGVLVERIVDFKDFEVLRVVLEAGAHYSIPGPAAYGIIMAVKGSLLMAGVELLPEAAAMIPATCESLEIVNSHEEEVSFLVAFPL